MPLNLRENHAAVAAAIREHKLLIFVHKAKTRFARIVRCTPQMQVHCQILSTDVRKSETIQVFPLAEMYRVRLVTNCTFTEE